ncbi:hypothetical protein CGCF413_v012665 [Colletotrichum fructicola]|nr:hypothetical protein CGCF413_v012665 [Colletotrichum fructicola]
MLITDALDSRPDPRPTSLPARVDGDTPRPGHQPQRQMFPAFLRLLTSGLSPNRSNGRLSCHASSLTTDEGLRLKVQYG